MKHLLPPLFLVLALGALIAGFTLVMVPPPEAGIELHGAVVRGEDQLAVALENDLERRRQARSVSIVVLFVASGLFVAAAFVSMPEAR